MLGGAVNVLSLEAPTSAGRTEGFAVSSIAPVRSARSSKSVVQSITSAVALKGAAAIGPTTGTTSRTSPVTRNGSATTAQPESNVNRQASAIQRIGGILSNGKVRCCILTVTAFWPLIGFSRSAIRTAS